MKNDTSIPSFISSIRHSNKIPTVSVMDMQLDYVIYLVSQLTIATIDQLLEVNTSSRNQLAMSLQYGIRKGFVESESFVYYGVNLNYYFLTNAGKKRALNFLNDFDISLKDYSFRKNPKHFLEASELYLSIFGFSRDERFEREKWLMMEKHQTLRVDAELNMKLDQFDYNFSIEHDRGTERLDILMKKLSSEGYAFQMLSSEAQLIVMTVSREELINRKKALKHSQDSKVLELKKYMIAITKVRSLMNRFKLNLIEDLENAMASVNENSSEYSDVIFRESYDSIQLVIDLAKAFNIRTKAELILKHNELDTLKSTHYYALLKESAISFENSRVDKIIEAILNQDNDTRLEFDIVSRYSASLRENGKVIDGQFYLPSFKSQLLNHEFIIGPLNSVKAWMSLFADEHDKASKWIEDNFGYKLESLSKGINCSVNGVPIRKALCAYNGYDANSGLNIGVMMLDVKFNVSDRLRAEIMETALISHSYDKLIVVITSGENRIKRFEV